MSYVPERTGEPIRASKTTRWPVLRSVVLVALAAGAFVVVRKRRNAQADAALWREATSTR